jgi:peroxiredoxin
LNTIQVGRRLPRIVLPDQNKNSVDLQSLSGRKLLLSFHPLAWTGACTRQMEALEMNFDALEKTGAIALGISVDPVPSKKAWAESIHVEKTRLLSDFWPHGKVAQSLGLFRKKDGFSERAVVLADQSGVVRFVKVYPIQEVPNVDELIRMLESF